MTTSHRSIHQQPSTPSRHIYQNEPTTLCLRNHDVLQVSSYPLRPPGSHISHDTRAQRSVANTHPHLHPHLSLSTPFCPSLTRYQPQSWVLTSAQSLPSPVCPLLPHIPSIIQFQANPPIPESSSSFSVSGSGCDKEDEADCKEFCGLSEQTATCSANGNKVTCSCKGGKSESNCEERCLLCKSRATPPAPPESWILF